VGAGPAGLACSAAVAAAGLHVVLFECTAPGGQLNQVGEVQAYAGGPFEPAAELAGRLTEYALNAGAEFRYEEVTGIDRVGPGWRLNGGEVFAELVIASGSEVDLGKYPGAESRVGRGVSVCATCDGPLFRGRPVIVAGCGRDARYEADELRKYASDVVLLRTPKAATLGLEPGAQAASPEARLAPFRAIDVDEIVACSGDPLESVTYRVGTEVHTLPAAGFFPAGDRVSPHERWLRPGPASPARSIIIGDARPGGSRTVLEAMGDGVRAAQEIRVRAPS
jgi:thioredoxin reductase (NADPH)